MLFEKAVAGNKEAFRAGLYNRILGLFRISIEQCIERQ